MYKYLVGSKTYDGMPIAYQSTATVYYSRVNKKCTSHLTNSWVIIFSKICLPRNSVEKYVSNGMLIEMEF